MKRSIIFIIPFIFNTLSSINCQTSTLEIVGKIETLDGVAISGATAEIYDGNTKIKSVNTGMNGELTFNLDYGKTYKVYISKDGLIKKRLDFETNIPVDQQRELTKEFAMTLVENCEGASLSVFDDPVDKIEYDYGIRNFVSSKSYYEQMQSKIAGAYLELERCKQKKVQDKKTAAELATKQGNFEEAKKLYQEALLFYPNDANLKRLVSQAQKNIEQQGSNQVKYDQLIKEADQFMAQNQLSAAKQRYSEAAKLNNTSTYPKDKIKEIESVVSKQSEQVKQQQTTNNQYNDVLAQANSAMAAKNYQLAKQLYEQATKLKPSEAFPAQKAAEAQRTMEKQAQDAKTQETNDKAYQEAIAQGQLALDKGDLKTAQQFFQSATNYKPGESLPRQKIVEAQKIESQKKDAELKAQRSEVLKQFNETVQKADGLLAQKDYDNAINAYKAALEIVPSDAYTQSQIIKAQNKKVESAKKSQTEIEKAYNDAIALGDSKKLAKEFEAAAAAYQQALLAKADDPVAQTRLKETQKLLSDQLIRTKEEQETKVHYNQLIQEADGLFRAQNYEVAKTKYKEALVIYTNQSYPLNQIATIDNILSKNQKETEYSKLIAEADRLFAQQDFTKAKAQYNAASLLIPEKTYPQQKLNEINKQISDLARKEIKDKYDQIAVKAEEAITKQNYDEAKSLYAQAMQVMPENPFPKTRINEINSMIGDRARKDVEEKYNNLVQQADAEVSKQNYEQAKTLYGQAILVMPDNPYPQKKINEISALISDKARKAIEEKYNALAAQAEQQVTLQNFDQAKTLYTQAMQVMPENPKPSTRINEINAMITDKARKDIEEKYNNLVQQADAETSKQNYEQAKTLYGQAMLVMPDNPYPQKKINEISALISDKAKKAIEEKYNALAAQAEQQVVQQNYDLAKTLYSQATQVMPENPYPKTRINEINTMITDKARKNIEEKYNNLVQQANAETSKQNYEQAKTLYGQAMLVMPENPYPQKKINEISALISDKARKAIEEKYNAIAAQAEQQVTQQNFEQAKTLYNQASQVMPENPYPATRINEINNLITDKTKKDIEDKYKTLVTLAEQQVTEKNYEQAKASYRQALIVMPESTVPQKRINEINALIDNLAKTNKEQKYNQLLADADGYFNKQLYNEAKEAYNKAQIEAPEKPYPTQKINEINQLLAKLALKEIDDNYNKAITEGDKLLSEQKYSEAKTSYNSALQIKPEQAYPQQKINEISSVLANLAKLENDKSAIKNKYDQTIILADKYFSDKNYPLARTEYSNALAILADETYPTTQISKIDQLVAEQKRKDSEQLELEKQFNTLITRADELFKTKKLIDAKQLYQQSLEIKPSNPQATSQITRIDELLALQSSEQQKITDANNKYNSLITEADSKFNSNSLTDSRKLYYASLEVKPNEEYPKSQIRRIDEKVKLSATNQHVNTNTTTDDGTSKLGELSFKTENERAKYLADLKKSYQPGVTLEAYKEKNKTINRYIVIRGNEVHELREIIYSYGVTQCLIDGKPTNAMYLQSLVKPKQGENFSKSEK